MEALRTWLRAVLSVGFLTAAAQSVMPEGAVKEVGRLVCGLLLFLTVARPVLGLSYQSVAARLREEARELSEAQAELEQERGQLEETVIADRMDAYLEDKSAALGLDCEMEALWDRSGAVMVPSGVIVTGTLTDEQRRTLNEALCEELGLCEEEIQYEIPEEAP